MPRTKPKSGKPKGASNANADGAVARPEDDVLTLSEAAEYLRVAESDVLQLLLTERLPGRKIGEEWRILRAAIKKWLSADVSQKGILRHFGKIKDDPYYEEMLDDIYRRRRESAEEN